jgi:hypothetical protein
MAVITSPELLLATISTSPWSPSSLNQVVEQHVGTRILPVGQPAASR